METPTLKFVKDQIDQAKISASASKKADDTCSQHGRFTDLMILLLDVSHMNLSETADIKDMLEHMGNNNRPSGTPLKTIKQISFSVKDGLQLQGYGALAAVFIIFLIIVLGAVVGGMFITA